MSSKSRSSRRRGRGGGGVANRYLAAIHCPADQAMIVPTQTLDHCLQKQVHGSSISNTSSTIIQPVPKTSPMGVANNRPFFSREALPTLPAVVKRVVPLERLRVIP